MTAKALIIGLWFAAPFAACFLWLNLFKAFMDWSGGSFDRFGQDWIWLKCAYYGSIGMLVGVVLILQTKWNTKGLLLCVPILLIVLDCVPHDELWNYSYVDQAIDFVGYSISRIFPYVPRDSKIPLGESTVIPPLSHITVKTSKGTLGIISGDGLLRTYEWDGVKRSLELIPPGAGKYDDHSFHSRRFLKNGTRRPAYDWANHAGITRGEAWEIYKNFATLGQANVWLEGQRDPALPCVWTKDGLVIGFSTDVDWKSLTVVVYQVLIAGKKPSHLAGSDDLNFTFQKVSG
ncbi:MAG TPA: hypothetical protein V6C81_14025 [Planktothrix sp.]|jgi:hypothetical protein